MKYRPMICGLLLGCVALLPLGAQDAKDKVNDKPKPEAKTDITAEVREMNSDKFAAPPTKFRPGHANPRTLDAKAITKTEMGFAIKLPSGSPVPTPTIYKGKIYVSGGFSTKEYYCFSATTGKLEWAVDIDDDGPTSAVVEDDIVVFNTESCTIFALDAKTGKHIWSHFLGDPLTSTPTIANGKVYTSYPANVGLQGGLNGGGGGGGGGGVLKKVGKIFKKGQNPPANTLPVVPPDDEVDAKPAKGGGKRAAASHAFICLELKTGKIVWQKWIDSDVMSAPVAVDDEIYATTFSGTVYKFKQKDGAIVSATRSRATSAPVIVGNNVYWTQRADHGKDEKCAEEIAGLDRAKGNQTFSSAKREAIYLDAKTQIKSGLAKAAQKLDAGNALGAGMGGFAGYANIGQGTVSAMQAFQGSRILHFKNANYNCMGDELINTDPKDGKVRWKVKLKGDLAKLGGHLATPPAAAGGQLFVATLLGEVLQIDPEKGAVAKTYRIGAPTRSQPAIVAGRIYVGTETGQVVCIDTGDARFTGWATWGANMAHTNLVEK